MNAAGSSQTTGGFASLDDVLHQLTTSTNLNNLHHYLKSFAPKESRDIILASTLSSGQDPLSVLDPQRNTLGYLYIISARLHSAAAPTPTISVIETFCNQFDPAQARLAPERVTLLAKGIVRVSESSNNAKYALGPLYSLVTRYPPHLSYLTTLHAIFLKTCVATGHFTTALPILAVPITSVDTSVSDLHYNDNLVYHYSGGMALGALKRWREAEEFFELCVSAPAQVPAAIQLEAYKKLVLVQLIQYGETTSAPKYTHPALSRLLKGTPYGAFIKMYPAQISTLRAHVTKEQEQFAQDRNMGLINQAIDRSPVWLIKKLTATYLTLGLADIGREVGIESDEEIRAIILSMIDAGEINATISADNTVTFADVVPKFSKEDLDRILVQAQEHNRALLDVERAVNTSKEYLTKVSYP
ncbi:uncharacterized protein TRAVEDRAFT_127525 [Trametes versicolor FP-101664 SS1]|uniref:uncharacterized protein n=1 Tax=Trametes versicolor (strain FP-101664) TaxID=717944 RepID=UPI000462191D|nr:uncharacterized protein TRAVEDRAFT_127525 [Trametes versicolor FP-101664 SS1]EIW56333.1 hypothetical protein TRAVEDRAFT_127525 [Trametes versicolor FP-101664 SS1]